MKKVNLFIQTEGRAEPSIVEVSEDATVHDVLTGAKEAGLISEPIDEDSPVAVFLQDEDDELDGETSIAAAGLLEKPRVHLGRRGRRIDVTVRFNRQEHTHRFGPGRTVDGVLRWTIRKFKLSGTQETEYALVLCVSDEYLDPATHIGCLVEPKAYELCFELVLEDTVQG